MGSLDRPDSSGGSCSGDRCARAVTPDCRPAGDQLPHHPAGRRSPVPAGEHCGSAIPRSAIRPGSPIWIGARSHRQPTRRAGDSGAQCRWCGAKGMDVAAIRSYEALGGPRPPRWISTAPFSGCQWAADLLVPRFAWAKDGADVLAQVHALRLGADVGLAGRAWNTRRPVIARDVSREPGYAIAKAALRDGLRGAVAIPAVAQDEALAVLAFGSRETLEPSDRLLRSLMRIGCEVGDFLMRRRPELQGSPLTPRQRQILHLAADGYSRSQIAAELKIKPSTVRTHLEHIYARLEVSDRVAAVAKAMRDGLIK